MFAQMNHLDEARIASSWQLKVSKVRLYYLGSRSPRAVPGCAREGLHATAERSDSISGLFQSLQNVV